MDGALDSAEQGGSSHLRAGTRRRVEHLREQALRAVRRANAGDATGTSFTILLPATCSPGVAPSHFLANREKERPRSEARKYWLKIGGASRDRTDDLIVANDRVSQTNLCTCYGLDAEHGPFRSNSHKQNSGLPGELPQHFSGSNPFQMSPIHAFVFAAALKFQRKRTAADLYPGLSFRVRPMNNCRIQSMSTPKEQT
jgi:hypothetical protein